GWGRRRCCRKGRRGGAGRVFWTENNGTTATIRYGTTNQPGKTATSPLTEAMPNAAAEPATAVATAAPRTSSKIEGMPAPSATAATMSRLDAVDGRSLE